MNLVAAVLPGAHLSHAVLAGANLRGADLTGANLTGADLTDARWAAAGPAPEGWKRTDSGLLMPSAAMRRPLRTDNELLSGIMTHYR